MQTELNKGKALNTESFCDLETETERAHIYALLSALLAAPAKQELITIINNCHIETDFWQALKHNFTTANLDSLDDEYHRLFIGIGTGELLPYCSHYLTGSLMNKPLSNLKSDIYAMGLRPQTAQKDPADHIAGIFEIMRLSIMDLSLSSESQKEFFKNNILSWVDDFFIDLTKIKDVKHYHLVAQFGQWFMQVEKQYFSFI